MLHRIVLLTTLVNPEEAHTSLCDPRSSRRKPAKRQGFKKMPDGRFKPAAESNSNTSLQLVVSRMNGSCHLLIPDCQTILAGRGFPRR